MLKSILRLILKNGRFKAKPGAAAHKYRLLTALSPVKRAAMTLEKEHTPAQVKRILPVVTMLSTALDYINQLIF